VTAWKLRAEQSGDEAAIHDLVKRAFAPMPFSAGDEQDLVAALRAAGELSLSLVAVDDFGVIIGHVGFSPVTIDNARQAQAPAGERGIAPRENSFDSDAPLSQTT
jgi:putative acetyltransferase